MPNYRVLGDDYLTLYLWIKHRGRFIEAVTTAALTADDYWWIPDFPINLFSSYLRVIDKSDLDTIQEATEFMLNEGESEYKWPEDPDIGLSHGYRVLPIQI